MCPCQIIAPLESPTPSPTMLSTSSIGILNTLYIVGTNVSQLENSCGLNQFEQVMVRSLSEVLAVDMSNIEAVQVYDLILLGLTQPVVAVSFEVRTSNVDEGADEIDSGLNSAIRDGRLLLAMQRYADDLNCSLGDSEIGGYNGDIPGYEVQGKKSNPCGSFRGDEWEMLYGGKAYGPWAAVLVAAWSVLMVWALVLSTKYTSCISYGIVQSPKLKYLWALLFAAITCRLVVSAVVLTAWRVTDQEMDEGQGFACAELEGQTPSDVSARSVQAIVLLFYALSVCILAGACRLICHLDCFSVLVCLLI